jgi:hypothetical protein
MSLSAPNQGDIGSGGKALLTARQADPEKSEKL